MPTTLHENRPSAGIGVVEVQKPMVFLRFLKFPRNPLRGSAWSRCKNSRFFRFLRCSRDPLRGSVWSRCKNSRFFCDFCGARATLCGDRRGRGAKTRGFLRFLRCPRNPLRGSAWSRCKNSRFFAISAVLAQPSAGIGVVEVQKLEVFCDFCCSNWSSGVVSWFARLLPEPAGRGFGPRAGVARCNLHFKATCAEQLAQSKLHRATFADQLAPTSLRRAPCLEQLAQSNLRRATYAEQLAQSNLHRAPCLVLSRASFTNASCREKERILQRWADLACDVLLSGQPWSSFLFFCFLVPWLINTKKTKKQPII